MIQRVNEAIKKRNGSGMKKRNDFLCTALGSADSRFGLQE